MKDNCFLKRVIVFLMYAGILLSSCTKDPEMFVPLDDIVIEAIQIEPVTFDIMANVVWTVDVVQEGNKWLDVSPRYGKGNATITIETDENIEFIERVAFIAITGEGFQTDSIKIVQTSTLDVAEKIEDEILRQYCLDMFDDSPKDGKISAKEARFVMMLDIEEMNIQSLVGIEYFTQLKKLRCSDNEIKEIDISKNKVLKELDCSNNPIDRLDVSELPMLADLRIHSTKITQIDVRNNPALYLLTISNSPITSIDVSDNKELSMLLCNNNQLTELDVSKNAKLLMLSCGNNKLSTINLSMNPNLVNLYCNDQTDGNKQLLTNLDISQNKAIQSLSCAQNALTELDISNNPALTSLRCEDNLLTHLDISKNTKLEELRCNHNRLNSSLNISNNKTLKWIYLTQNPNLSKIYVWRGFDESNRFFEKDKDAQWIVQ